MRHLAIIPDGITTFTATQEKFLDSLTGMGLKEASIGIKEHFNLKDSVEDILALKVSLANNYHSNSTVEFIEGFEEFHKKLTTHSIPSGIATNAHPHNLEGIVKAMKLDQFFGNNIYCVAHVDYKSKPDPALFLHTAKMLGVNPEDCVVFEDSIHGFLAAKAAGIKCIAVKNKSNTNLLHHADDVIETYHQAEEVLKRIL